MYIIDVQKHLISFKTLVKPHVTLCSECAFVFWSALIWTFNTFVSHMHMEKQVLISFYMKVPCVHKQR